jgi:putative nucleotidyltransferase with HDIG domain
LRENLSLARVLRANARALGLVSVSYFILGLLMALAYLRVGAGSAALLLPALVVTQGSLKNQLDLERARASAIRALSSAIDARDPYTRGHSERVRAFAVRVARHLGLSESTVEALEVAALLHDLGKVSIDPGVLGKPAPLSADERAQMHAHADAGARVMGEMAYLARHADMVRCHHERLDGGGYPRGLNSEEIPLGARILHVVDALDAMTSDRPYRRALPLAEASRELSVCAGTQFDENVVRAVLELLDRGELKPPATSPSEEDAGGPPSAGDEPSAGGGDESRNHGVQGVNREDHSMAPDR